MLWNLKYSTKLERISDNITIRVPLVITYFRQFRYFRNPSASISWFRSNNTFSIDFTVILAI
jgi:hypothetical protein